MSCEKCGTRKGLCPVTLGLALGITFALCVLFWGVWAMWFGLPAGMEEQMHMMVAHDWASIVSHSVWALLKGFVGGFVFALIYDLLLCCKSKCCGKCSCCNDSSKK